MTIPEITAKLRAQLDSPPVHTHSKSTKRHFSRWEPYYDREESGKLRWILYDVDQIPCRGRLFTKGLPKVEIERDCLVTKVVASRQFVCARPVIKDSGNMVLMYAAMKIEDVA